jgi:hydroxyacylglutathione hydrolase
VVEILRFSDEGLGNSSYLVEIGDRRALLIDPPRDIEAVVQLARSKQLTLSHAVETHLHADFVSGSRELGALGATVLAARAAGLEWPHVGLTDGDEVDLGGLILRAIGTPGHTPEHLSYLLLDASRPVALFSGGALLPGSIARTDLIAPDQTEPLARALYRSLNDRIMVLPDDVVVYPTHGAGSFCSASEDGARTTTIGRERATNPSLSAPSEDEFVRRVLTSFGTYPPYFLRLREVNRRGARVYGRLPDLRPMDLHEFDRALADGAEIIDVRHIAMYAAGHIPGSLSIALRAVFASWLGWLVEFDRPLVFVLAEDQDRREVVRQALGIGYEDLLGELRGGIAAWAAAGRPVSRTALSTTPPGPGRLVDVRQASEYRAGHVAGAIPLELGALVGPTAVDVLHDATVMCGHGERAMSAASIAERRGIHVAVFEGSPARLARLDGRDLVLDDVTVLFGE